MRKKEKSNFKFSQEILRKILIIRIVRGYELENENNPERAFFALS
jgi:hypothetical protein